MIVRMSKPAPHAAEFARYYDLIYSDKNYIAEVELFEALVGRYSPAGVASVLEAGCGTGGHALLLAERGYDICAVDRSGGMLEIARAKPQGAGSPIEWVEQDLQTLELSRTFDACASFFGVLSFQLSNEDMMQALRSIRRHLEPSGLLLADVWYGPTVLSERPEKRLKIVEASGHRLLKYSTPELDPFHHTNVVHQHVLVLDEGKTVVAEIEEAQTVRFWFPQELKGFLEHAGFEVLSFFAYPDADRLPSSGDWDLGFVARAIPAE